MQKTATITITLDLEDAIALADMGRAIGLRSDELTFELVKDYLRSNKKLREESSTQPRKTLRETVNDLTVKIEEIRTQAAADRQQAAIDRQAWQAETRRIWEYLEGRDGGTSTPG
jgi:hypothetical protein